jgi:hypothetical protein
MEISQEQAGMKMMIMITTNIIMIEAASTSETSVSFYQTALRNIPAGSHLHTRR